MFDVIGDRVAGRRSDSGYLCRMYERLWRAFIFTSLSASLFPVMEVCLLFSYEFIKIALNLIDQHPVIIRSHEICGRQLAFNFVCFWSLAWEIFVSGSYPTHILCGIDKLWTIIIANIDRLLI